MKQKKCKLHALLLTIGVNGELNRRGEVRGGGEGGKGEGKERPQEEQRSEVEANFLNIS